MPQSSRMSRSALARACEVLGKSVESRQYDGNEENITAFVVRSSSEQDAGVDIAFTDLISISTTAITLSGGRFGLLLISISIQNDAGGARDYTFQIDRDNITILGPFLLTVEGSSTFIMSVHKFQDPTPVGLVNYVIHGKSSSGAGTQRVIESRLSVIEW